jgi:hypothetical protein
MWRGVSGFAVTCGGIFAIVAWLTRHRVAKQRKPSAKTTAGGQFTRPASPNVSRSSRIKISFAAIASGLTIILSYLAIAVSAHWFPWQISIPSISLNLYSGALSDASWNSDVVGMINFLNDHKSEDIHLNLIMQSETRQLFSGRTFSNSNEFLYVETKRNVGTTDISMGAYCASSELFKCSALTIYITAGPGANLGYDDGDTAVTAFLDGYFQVGKISCQTWICQINIIPIEPPSKTLEVRSDALSA